MQLVRNHRSQWVCGQASERESEKRHRKGRRRLTKRSLRGNGGGGSCPYESTPAGWRRERDVRTLGARVRNGERENGVNKKERQKERKAK